MQANCRDTRIQFEKSVLLKIFFINHYKIKGDEVNV